MFTRFNMKKIALWLTAIMFIAFGVAGSIFALGKSGIPLNWGTNRNNTAESIARNSGSSEVDQNTSNKADGLKSIDVSSASARVNIIPSDTQEVKAHLYGTTAVVPKLTANESGGSLQIKTEYPLEIGVHLNYTSLTLDIEIPKSYSGEFSGSTVSGPFVINDFKFEKMSIKSVSGAIKAKNINAGSTTVSTTSGTTDLENLSGGLSFKSVSGELNAVLQNSSDKVEISTTSGAMNIKGLVSDFTFSSVSGALEADFMSVNGNLKLHSTSGALHLKLPENSDFDLNYKTTSGGFKSSFPLTANSNDKHNVIGTAGKGGHQIQADTVSGALELIKK